MTFKGSLSKETFSCVSHQHAFGTYLGSVGTEALERARMREFSNLLAYGQRKRKTNSRLYGDLTLTWAEGLHLELEKNRLDPNDCGLTLLPLLAIYADPKRQWEAQNPGFGRELVMWMGQYTDCTRPRKSLFASWVTQMVMIMFQDKGTEAGRSAESSLVQARSMMDACLPNEGYDKLTFGRIESQSLSQYEATPCTTDPPLHTPEAKLLGDLIVRAAWLTNRTQDWSQVFGVAVVKPHLNLRHFTPKLRETFPNVYFVEELGAA